MQISDLIQRLTAILAEQGDLEVYCWAYCGQPSPTHPALDVDVADGANHVLINSWTDAEMLAANRG